MAQDDISARPADPGVPGGPGTESPRRRSARPSKRPDHRRANGSDVLQERIKHLIIEDGLGPGDTVPTELELIERLDAGRSSVREALKALQAVGIVEIRHGFGTFVGKMSLSGLVHGLAFQSQFALENGQQDLNHLMNIREVIEHGMLAQLIALPEQPDLTAVEGVIARMKREARIGHIQPDTDRLFHEALYLPLGNPLLGPLLGAFWNVSNSAESIYAKSADKPADTVRNHEDIYLAVRRRDLTAAITTMTNHFSGVRARLQPRTQRTRARRTATTSVRSH